MMSPVSVCIALLIAAVPVFGGELKFVQKISEVFEVPHEVQIGSNSFDSVATRNLRQLGMRGQIVETLVTRAEGRGFSTEVYFAKAALFFSWRKQEDGQLFTADVQIDLDGNLKAKTLLSHLRSERVAPSPSVPVEKYEQPKLPEDR